MASPYEAKFAEGARPFLGQDEEVLASCIAQAKGFTRMTVSGMDLGRSEVARSGAAADAGEVRVDPPS
jgi:hypothetical protein